MRRSLLLLFLLFLLAACNDPDSPDPVDLAATINPARQWSGGIVTITTDLFTALTDPVVVAGSDTLQALVLNDSTWQVSLPRDTSGDIGLLVRGIDHEVSLGTVSLAGFRDMRVTPFDNAGDLEPWPWNNPTGVIGSTEGGRLFTLTASEAVARLYPGILSGSWLAVGTSYRPFVVLVPVLGFDAESLMAWDLAGVPTEVGRYRVPNLVRHVFELAPETWLVDGSHIVSTKISQDGQTFTTAYSETNDDTRKLYFSPRGDLATIWVSRNLLGVPVFELATGELAYHLPFTNSSAAAFSPDGERLYMVGKREYGADSLARFDANTGALDAAILLDGVVGLAIGVDPAGEWVYLPVFAADGKLRLRVYHADDLALVTELEAREQPSGCFPCGNGGVVIPALIENTVYYIHESGQTPIMRWDLLR